MRVTTYDLNGTPGLARELRRDDPATLWLDNQLVLAVSLWGDYVALTLTEQLVLIRTSDYERLIGYRCGGRRIRI